MLFYPFRPPSSEQLRPTSDLTFEDVCDTELIGIVQLGRHWSKFANPV